MRKEVPNSEIWVCESCGRGSFGKDPPDKCAVCEGEYFDNFEDIVKEAGGFPGGERLEA